MAAERHPLPELVSFLETLMESLLARVAPKRRLTIAPEALSLLTSYYFPGNVRELRNVLERASLMCDGDILRVEHFPEELLMAEPDGGAVAKGAGAAAIAMDWETIERQAFLRVVRGHQGSRRELAQRLGISERTLYRKLKAIRVG